MRSKKGAYLTLHVKTGGASYQSAAQFCSRGLGPQFVLDWYEIELVWEPRTWIKFARGFWPLEQLAA